MCLLALRTRRPGTGVSRPVRARSVPGVSSRVSAKTGVSEGVSYGVSAGPFGPRGHPVGHSFEHPRFRGHSRGHSGDTSGPKGPRDSCAWSASSQFSLRKCNPLQCVIATRNHQRLRCCYASHSVDGNKSGNSQRSISIYVYMALYMSNGIFNRTRQNIQAPLLSKTLSNEMHA